MHAESRFRPGECYSRKEIAEDLGGSDINYLPRVGDRIVCGCFTLEHNPDAPNVIIPGTGPEIEYTAKLFCEQKEAVPVFVKKQAGAWEYVGDYRVKSHANDKESIVRHHSLSITPVEKVTRVMFLERC